MKKLLILYFFLLALIGIAHAQIRHYGIVNKKNEVVIPFIYDYIYGKNGNLIYVSKNNLGGVIDSSGKEILPCNYDDIQLFDYGIYARQGKGRGMFHRDGSMAVPCIYDKIETQTYLKNFLLVTKDNKEGIIDTSGREIIPVIYESVGFVSEGLITICKGGFCGVVDMKKKLKIPFDYDGIGIFRNGNALAKKKGKWA